MAQSVLLSAIESTLNSASALLLGLVLNITVLPLFDLHPSFGDSVGMAVIFFFASVLRNMAWRRYFERRQQKGEIL